MIGIVLTVCEERPGVLKILMTRCVPKGNQTPLEEEGAQNILDAVHNIGIEKMKAGTIKGHYVHDPANMLKHE